MPHTAPSNLPLAGVRVVDFSRLLPGPWCAQTLGDLGADVIKVEQPEIGDYSRFNPPDYKTVGAYFNSVNRNKRSIVLDLTVEADQQVARELAGRADIIVESYRPGVPKKLGIDYATVSREQPGRDLLLGDGLRQRVRARPRAGARPLDPGRGGRRSASTWRRARHRRCRHSRRAISRALRSPPSACWRPTSGARRRASAAISRSRSTTA